jgi:hypothetical protein
MTAATPGRAARSTSDHPGRCYKPPTPYPQDWPCPVERHHPIPTDKVVWFALAITSARLRRLVAHFAARRL